MPAEYGSVTPRAAAVATAASTALPPFRSTAIPMFVASGSTDETAPPNPIEVGTFTGGSGVCATAPLAVRADRTSAPADRDATSFFGLTGISRGVDGLGQRPAYPEVGCGATWGVPFS